MSTTLAISPTIYYCRWGSSTVLRPNDDLWKGQRKIMNQAMPPNDTQRFHPKLLNLTHDLLRALPHSDDVVKTLRTTEEKQATGTATPSLTSVALGKMDHKLDLAKQEELIKTASVTAYAGEQKDPTNGFSGAFILAMLMSPEIQATAHLEIEQALGPGNLPNFGDEASLPYITAVVRETMRHNPVAPLAVPHELTQDDIYKGYFLPKGSLIMANVWSILHDEEDYPEPDLFNPSRFLDADGKIDPEVKDPTIPAFGFGRRVCPGKHMALASLWIVVASILACYSIEPELDENGNLIKPKAKWYSGPTLFNHPLPFKCRFVPRSKDVEVSLALHLSA
ncbi:hypothetical protein HHX47_DHR9000549 [Lentinula edodes]|nr:hypothetical protein HHX47_DHR9000549 [Lentinula edodes]